MLKGDYLWSVVEIVIGGIPTVLEVYFMCFFKSFGRILLEGSMSMNLFDPIRHQVNLWKVEVGIQLLGKLNLVADMISQDIHFVPFLGWRLNFSICFRVYLLLLHTFPSQGIGQFAGSPKEENILKGVNTMQGVFNVVQCCIIVRLIWRMHTEF
jgi:hypothetical protein